MERLFGGTDGSDIKIFTVETYTSYGFRDMPDLKTFHEAFAVMANILRDGIVECHNTHRNDCRQFDLGSLLAERPAVQNEVKMRKDDIPLAVSEELYRLMWLGTTNPARLAGTGNIKQLRKLVKPTTLKSIAADGYVPSELAVIGIGPSQDELLRLCAETGLDQLKPYKAAMPLYDGSDTEPHFKTVVTSEAFRPGINQTHVVLGWPAPTFMSKDGPALDVLARILKMRTEMLLRDANTKMDAGVYHPSSAWRATKWHGALDVWFATSGDGAHADWGTDQVLGICSRIKDDHSVALEAQVEAVRELCSPSLPVCADSRYALRTFGGLTMVKPNEVELETASGVSVSAPGGLEDLLVDWLDELVYWFEVQNLLVGDAGVRVHETSSGWSLEGEIRGETFDPRRHPIKVLIKGITYHQLAIRRNGDRWVTSVVFDI